MYQMITSPASSITKAASKQAFYTIEFLVDRERVEDAYRAHAYFRWMDDILDADLEPKHVLSKAETFGGPVLDLACGTGRLAILLAQKGFEVTAVDRSQGMLTISKSMYNFQSIFAGSNTW